MFDLAACYVYKQLPILLNGKTLSSCLTQIPITHAFHAVANRDNHIGGGDLADRTNK